MKAISLVLIDVRKCVRAYIGGRERVFLKI